MSEERKLVTVLFADIVGSTVAGAEHDPEIVRGALARTFAAARSVLETHGGTVEKFIGDAVMAVFGVPTAHDDDADRAIRAAFALRDPETGTVPIANASYVTNVGDSVLWNNSKATELFKALKNDSAIPKGLLGGTSVG